MSYVKQDIKDVESVKESNSVVWIWQRCSGFLLAIGACYLIGVLTIGIGQNVPVFKMVLPIIYVLLVWFCYFFAIGKAIKEFDNISIKIKEGLAVDWFGLGAVVLFVMFLNYLSMIGCVGHANKESAIECITKSAVPTPIHLKTAGKPLKELNLPDTATNASVASGERTNPRPK